jgi:drug/metabolite transporter (DMT)-like permease
VDATAGDDQHGLVTNATLARFLTLAVLWGSSFTLIKISLEGLSPAQLVLARLVLGALVLLAVAALRHVALPRGRAVWGHLAGAALFGQVLPFLLLSYGERSAGAGVAGVLIGATPLLTLAVASAALSTERATARKVIGLVVGFLGIVLVMAPWREAGGSLGGEIACFGAAVSYAISFVYIRRFLSPRGLPALSLATGQLIVAVALQALVSPLLEWGPVRLDARVLVSIVLLGALCTGLAYVLYFRLIGDIGATSASAVNYVVPVAAVVVGAVVLGEPVTWNVPVGGLIVLAGMAYAERRLSRPPAGAESPPARRGTA